VERVKKLPTFEQACEKKMSLENEKDKKYHVPKKSNNQVKSEKKESGFCCIS